VPKIVDRDSQRARFAEAAMRVIARDGLEGTNMRAVAAEAGLSYGSLFHYFKSKDELLIQAVKHSTSQQTRRVNEFTSRKSGLDALSKLLCDDAIVDDSSRDDWVVWQAFLYKAAFRPEFAEMHAELINGWVKRIQALLESAQADGEIGPEIDTDMEARAIWAYSAGIGQQGLLHPKLMSSRRQKQLIRSYLDKLRA
jgi:AcrR family transcriptional regulator